jgi:hypothetical protein
MVIAFMTLVKPISFIAFDEDPVKGSNCSVVDGGEYISLIVWPAVRMPWGS